MCRKVDVRLPPKGNSNSNCARPVHLIITMIEWIPTSRLSRKNYLSGCDDKLSDYLSGCDDTLSENYLSGCDDKLSALGDMGRYAASRMQGIQVRG